MTNQVVHNVTRIIIGGAIFHNNSFLCKFTIMNGVSFKGSCLHSCTKIFNLKIAESR